MFISTYWHFLEMERVRILYTLYCISLLATAWGNQYNLKRVGVCLQIVCEATSDVALRILPLFHDFNKCTKFRSELDLDSLSFLMFAMVAFSWLQSLALEIHCLWQMDDRLRLVLAPHWERLKQYDCMYLGVPPKCIPKL